MAAQWEPSRRTGTRPGEPVTRPGGPGEHPTVGQQPAGRPVTRVDFFRRMPTGGGTVYFKPAAPQE
ncbi:hypothetical protein [Amycolatopsis sacchari]|uniref:hypothetical protein n=1 Tax=Amycolatopsis sacchari TaxID=115433 RepID=UPI003D743EE7